MEKVLVLLDGSNEIVNFKGIVKYIRGRSIKMVQYFTALVKIEDEIWSSVGEHGRFVVSIHGRYVTGNIKMCLTSKINECQHVGNGIWVVENL